MIELGTETAATVALLRSGRHPRKWYAAALRDAGSARALLAEQEGLLAESVLADARAEVRTWERRGIKVLTPINPGYPANLGSSESAPPLLFVAGELLECDGQGVAVIGTRQPAARGIQTARAVSRRLVSEGYTVLSGLAAGIDTAAHESALESGGRTVAVIGSGLDHCYPRENARLQRRIAVDGAVVSQFWPESRPSRSTFPLRNELMAGMAQAAVIVEANAMSGTRILARAAVSMRRVVVLLETLMDQPWARELSQQPGVEVAGSTAEVAEVLESSLALPAVGSGVPS